jgi:tetratricopeptide (TPR) repeat protein
MGPGARAAVAVAAAAGLAGCASTGPAFRCPARGGPEWRVLTGEHFAIATDLDGPDAHALAEELELLRAAAASSMFTERHDPPVRVSVVAFRDQREFEELAPPEAAAYYALGASEAKIVLPGALGTEQRRIVAHEIAHHIASYVLLRQPRWLSEGLSTWTETLGASAAADRGMVLGAIPQGRGRPQRPRRISVEELFAWDDTVPPGRLGDYYDAAWLLVHYLMAQHPEQLRDLERRLNGAEDPATAFRESFPDWDPRVPGALGRLDHRLDVWAVVGRFEPRPVQVVAPVRVTERPLPPAEVHAIRLLLWSGRPPREGDDEAWRREVEEALAEDPAHPVVLRALAQRDGRDPLPLARASVAAHPGDSRAWGFLAESLPPGTADREAALRRAVELAPANAAALEALARVLLEAERSGEALPLARRSVQLAPFHTRSLETYAAVAADLGQCSQALLAARRALDVLPAEARGDRRKGLEQNLARYRERCAPPGPSASDGPVPPPAEGRRGPEPASHAPAH